MITVLSVLPALAQAQAQAQDGGGDPAVAPPPGAFGGNFLFIMVAMIAIIYFIMIRPEQKRQKERQKMLSALKKGDKILTVGGIMGVITGVKDASYAVKSGEGAVIEITKSAVQSLIVDPKDAGAKDAGGQVKEMSGGGKESK
jgi:preprotein translocase subunit YajC